MEHLERKKQIFLKRKKQNTNSQYDNIKKIEKYAE